jgi:Na+-translocating ferredoxin:NAD+ oxidoreductase subunit B
MTLPLDPTAIDALLPQTQCTRCGYQGCRPYAEAIARGEAAINQCPPGGAATIDGAGAADRPARAAAQSRPTGMEGPRTVAFVLEEHCIGCTKCLPACPVDAIVGAPKRMHTVIAAECTGCELCIAPCPVDCIVMLPDPLARGPIEAVEAAGFRVRYEAHEARTARREAVRTTERDERRAELAGPASAVAAALARARAKKPG